MPRNIWSSFDDIVLGGALQDNGMASFKDVLTPADAHAIKAYILDQAHLAWDQAHPKKSGTKPPAPKSATGGKQAH
jgi:quinohemoprotein ethanol dehydrogenase